MSKFFLVLIISLVTLSMGGYFFVITEISNREGLSTHEGISVIHSNNVSISNLEFDLHVTDNPQKLLMSFDLIFQNNDPSFVAFVIPYSGSISGSNNTMHCWTSKPFADATQRLIFREFPCTQFEEIELYKNKKVHHDWRYDIYDQVDSIKDFSHKVTLQFFPAPNNQEMMKFIIDEYPHELITNWLEADTPKAKITVSNFFEKRISIPETESKQYVNSNNEITNDVSYSWNISNDSSLFTLDFSSDKELWQSEYRSLLAPVLFSTGISLLVILIGHHITIEHNQKKAKKLVNRDFIMIHNILLEKIDVLRNELRSLNRNTGIVDDLVNHNTSPHDVMLKFIRGLLFRNWNTVLPWLSDLNTEENEILNQLHDYIVDSNQVEEISTNPVVEQLITIINNPTLTETQKRNEVFNLINSKLKRWLIAYDTIYHRLHNELQKVSWIHLPDTHLK